MSKFYVPVIKIEKIHKHPDADLIELVQVGDYRSIIEKGKYKEGDLVAYIPESSIIPDWLIKNLGLEGKLAGSQHNRVKAIKLRGVLSEGICWNDGRFTEEMEDVSGILGITKYEPPIPTYLSGQIINLDTNLTFRFDVEDYKKFPQCIQNGERVIFREKIHGTFCQVGYNKKIDSELLHNRNTYATCKKYAKNGTVFQKSADNVYTRVLTGKEQLADKIVQIAEMFNTDAVYINSEIFGRGIQDMQYGQDKHVIKTFQIIIGQPKDSRCLTEQELKEVCEKFDISYIQPLYEGPFTPELAYEFYQGKETITGKELHIREGIVIYTDPVRLDRHCGWTLLKLVSEKYKLRKNGTEYT